MPKETTINVEQLEKLLESYSNDFIELTGGKVEETTDLFDLLLTNILELNSEEQKEHKGKLLSLSVIAQAEPGVSVISSKVQKRHEMCQ